MKASGFQLIKHVLVSVEYEVNPDYPKGSIPVEVQGLTKIEKTSENSATVEFTLFLFNKRPIEEVPFKVKTVHKGDFIWDDSYSEKQLKNLLNLNAPAILLSYDRSIIAQLTAYSDLPALILPLINFQSSSTE